MLILLVLILIFIQDLKDRSAYLLLFPFLAVLFLTSRLVQHQSIAEILWTISINVLFFATQLLIISIYFSIKNRRWVNITIELLGWGDILFLLSTTFYLSILSFLFFYITSLLGSLLIWLIWQAISKKKTKQIPLAGFQAFLLTIFLSTDWWVLHLGMTSDNWAFSILNK